MGCIFDSSCGRFLTPNRPSRALGCSIPVRLCSQVCNHTDAVLDLISVERKIPLQVAPFALRPLLEDVVAIAKSYAESEGLEITLHAPDLSTERMAGDAYRLKQVLLILVERMISLTRSAVMISAAILTPTCQQGPSCSDLVLRVQGIGSHMSEEQVDDLTEYVSKRSLDGAPDEERASLWVCGQIVSAMGGSLGIVREAGLDEDHGTCFFVSLSLLNWAASDSAEFSLSQGSGCHVLPSPLGPLARGWAAESNVTSSRSQSSEWQNDLPKEVRMQCLKPSFTALGLQSPRQAEKRPIEDDRNKRFRRSTSMDPRLISKIHAFRRSPDAGHGSKFGSAVSAENLLQVSSTAVGDEKEKRASPWVPGSRLKFSHSITRPFQGVSPKPVSPRLLTAPKTSLDPLRPEGQFTKLAAKAPSICGSKSDCPIMRQRKVRVIQSSSSFPVAGVRGGGGLRRQPSSSSAGQDEGTSNPVCPSDAAPQGDVHSLRELRLKALYVSTAPVNSSIIQACLYSVGLHEVHVVLGLTAGLKLFEEQPDIDVVIVDHEVAMEAMEFSKAIRDMQGSQRLYMLMLAQVLDAQLLRVTLNYSPDIVDHWLARPFSRARLSSLLMEFFVQPAAMQMYLGKASSTDLRQYLAAQRQSVLEQDSATQYSLQIGRRNNCN